MTEENTSPSTPPGQPAPPLARVVFTEGSMDLPPGYEDRSTNLLVPASLQSQPNLSVARDWMKQGETLPGYVERQLGLLKSQLASHKLLARSAVSLGRTDNSSSERPKATRQEPLVGLRIDASYKNGKLLVYQRQAAFEVAPRRVLIFTASRANGFGEAFEQLWADWLASYQAPAGETGTPATATGTPAA